MSRCMFELGGQLSHIDRELIELTTEPSPTIKFLREGILLPGGVTQGLCHIAHG